MNKIWQEVAERAAHEAAKIQTHYYHNPVAVRHKGEVDLVTEADLLSQEAIIKELSAAFPEHVVLAEEDPDMSLLDQNRPLWIVDPLDGTTNFAHRYPLFGVSIALVIDSKIEFALVHATLLNETYSAYSGHGAYLNGKPIYVSTQNDLSKSLLSTGFPYDRRESKNNNLELFCDLELSAQCVRRGGSAALDLAFVAVGRLEGFWEPKLKPWDIAAGILLVEEAGGCVTNYRGEKLTNLYGLETVASNSHIHSKLIQYTHKYSLDNSL